MIPKPDDDVKILSSSLVDKVVSDALKSPRKRMNFNFHPSLEDPLHRFMNIFLAGTYIPPHRHLFPPKSETFIILMGSMAFFTFDDDGKIKQVIHCQPLYDQNQGAEIKAAVDIKQGVWHTLIPVSKEAVCFEVKNGPYQAISDKEFAPFAPRENGTGIKDYLAFLKKEAIDKGPIDASLFQW